MAPNRKTQGTLDTWITRVVPHFSSPHWMDGNTWRLVVRRQMLAEICRDTLVGWMLQLPWKIRARDASKNDDFKTRIDHHQDLFLAGSTDTGEGYDVLIESLLKDTLDIPFGGLLEVERSGEKEGDLVGIYNVDGATLYPTFDLTYPVIQMITNSASPPVALKRDQYERIMLSPRTHITRKGYGMAPPERIYLALELLIRGDRYYANLLLDVPPAGALDLMDMSKASAEEWAEGLRELFVGSEAFKIPVLYEHEKPARYIPFATSPADLMFNETTLRYAALCCAGYGMHLRDIGITPSNRTLSGEIREERQTRRRGFGMLKTKLKYMFDRILPSDLEWHWINDDAEDHVALGRARLANSRACSDYIKADILTPEQALEQQEQDGLITIFIPPEDRPKARIEEREKLAQQRMDQMEQPTLDGRPPQEHHILGKPVPPSEGGHGEFKPSSGRQGPP